MNDLINTHDLFHLCTLVVAVAVLKNDMRWVKASIHELKKSFETHEEYDTKRFEKVDDCAREETNRVNNELNAHGLKIAVLRARKGEAPGDTGRFERG